MCPSLDYNSFLNEYLPAEAQCLKDDFDSEC
jgi:hypothetical protein